MIYLILAVYLLYLSCSYDFGHRKKGRSLHFWLAYALMVALMAFRYRVGGDTLNYIYTFENATSSIYALELFAVEKIQPIPAIIFAVCKTLFDDFTYVQAIFAIFVNAVVFWFFRKNTPYYFTAIFLYGLAFYLRLNCEIMRESLAISFFLIGYPYLMRQKYIKYYIFAVLAFLCHSSAIFIFILPVFLLNKKKSNVFGLLVLFGVIGLLLLYNMHFVGNLTHYAELYSDYKSSFFGKLSIVLFNILIPAYFLFITRHYISDYIKFGMYVYIGCSVVSLFFFIAFRFNNYLMVFYIMMVAECLNHIWHSKVKDMSGVRISLLGSVFLLSFMLSYFSDVTKYVGHEAKWYCVWYPYYSIFDPQVDDDRETFISNQGIY